MCLQIEQVRFVFASVLGFEKLNHLQGIVDLVLLILLHQITNMLKGRPQLLLASDGIRRNAESIRIIQTEVSLIPGQESSALGLKPWNSFF